MTPQALAREVTRLFTLPDVAIRLNELMEAPAVATSALEEVVQLDPGLTATVLRLANSAWYGLSSRVETVGQGITVIGQQALRDLVLSASVVGAARAVTGARAAMADFWEHSVACGTIARNLGRQCRLYTADRLFVAGLLHQVGRLGLYAARPEAFGAVLAARAAGEAAMLAAERDRFGFTHAELGAALLAQWRLPPLYQTLVAHQPAPLAAPEFRRETVLIHVACRLAGGNGAEPIGDPAGTFEPGVWELAGLEAGTLPAVREESLIQSFEFLEIINPRAATIL